jgi:hypothetical protein
MKRSSDDQVRQAVFSRDLPGTGGDIMSRNTDEDVEGHMLKREGDAMRREVMQRDGDGGPTGIYRVSSATEGEFAKRAPAGDPHGER